MLELLITLETSFTSLSQVSIESGVLLDSNNGSHNLTLFNSCYGQPPPSQGEARESAGHIVVSLDLDEYKALVISYTSNIEITFVALVLGSSGSEAVHFSEQDPEFGKIYDAFDNVKVVNGIVSGRMVGEFQRSEFVYFFLFILCNTARLPDGEAKGKSWPWQVTQPN